MFEEPTVAGLAERIEEARRGEQGAAAPPLVPVPRDGRLPLSFGQQRLWFLHQLEPVQVITPAQEALEVLITDLSELPQAKREDEARRLAREEARRPYDLRLGL